MSSRLFKVAVVVAAGVTSSLVTSAFMSARGPVAGATAARDRPRPKLTGAAYHHGTAPLPPRDSVDASDSVIGQYGLRVGVKVEGDLLHLKAESSIHDRRPGMRYVWAVHVFAKGAKDQPLFRKIYADQVFAVPQGEEVKPTFADVVEVPVPAGEYRVTLAAHEIPPGQTADTIDYHRGTMGPRTHMSLILGR